MKCMFLSGIYSVQCRSLFSYNNEQGVLLIKSQFPRGRLADSRQESTDEYRRPTGSNTKPVSLES